MEQSEIRYARRHIAYLDILGFTDLIRTSGSPVAPGVPLAAVQSLLLRATNHLNLDTGAAEWNGYWFSDTVVITASPDLAGLRTVLRHAHAVYGALLARGSLLRGGVALGDIYETSNLLFGPGLVDAYEVEQVAVHPRIAVADQIFEGHREALHNGDSPSRVFHLLREADGVPFVDPLATTPATMTADQWRRSFCDVANRSPPDDEMLPQSVLDKYEWMRSRLAE